MTDIFLSYESSDRERARSLAQALETRGWSVWWDRQISPGQSFQKVIQEAISSARCVIVMWTDTSVESGWVRDEAQEGHDRGILVPVSLDGQVPPMGFRQLQTADLTGWHGETADEEFKRLCIGIEKRLRGEPEPVGKDPRQDSEREVETQPGAVPQERPELQGHQAGEGRQEDDPEAGPDDGGMDGPSQPQGPAGFWRNKRLIYAAAGAALALVAAAAVLVLYRYVLSPSDPTPRPLPAEAPGMQFIPSGCFRMGSTHPALASAQPERDVCVRRDYLIGTHEVTFADYETYALETGAERLSDQGWGRADRPVINVNFQEARDYARWFGQRVGGDCGLPTEAEWEYAARAGTTSAYALPAPGGGDDIAGRELANCNGCGGQWEGRQTAPVGQFPANARGLYDMHGNVLEWVEDCWHDNYEDAPADGSAWLEDNDGKCRQRVVRGGSWALGPLSLHSAYRHSYSDLTESPELGFRVACR